jgi:hypothetical protein
MVGAPQQQVFSEGAPQKPVVTNGLPWLGWAILLLTAVISITWSAHKLLEQDEIFSLQTDRVPTLAEVLHIQHYYPISLEPPPYHVLSHAAIAVFGPTAFALRLPALMGYLFMQLCLYFFVRNLAGTGAPARRTGLLAMAIPALTWTLYYSAEGRPYGVLLGCYAAAALCWQVSARRNLARVPRTWPLLGLASALALTVNVHFYGILLLIPICGAEAVRSFDRRHLDRGMLLAIATGIASISLALPFVKASEEFKKHYYAGPVSAHMLTQPYRQMLIDYTAFSKVVQTLLIILLLIVATVVLWACIHAVRQRQVVVSGAEVTLVTLLVLMPGFAFVLGKFVTHALEVRHSIGAIVAITTLFALAFLPVVRRSRPFASLIAATITTTIIINGLRIRSTAADQRHTLAGLKLSADLKSVIDSSTDKNLYFQDLGQWETASLYEPDQALRSRLVLVYSRGEEMKYEDHDTMYLTATHTMKFSPQPITSYDQLRTLPGDHIFVTYRKSGWDWTSEAFFQEAAQVQLLGRAFGGNVVKVRFKQ